MALSALSVIIKANTKPLKRGLRGAIDRVGRFSKSVARLTTKILPLTGAITALAGSVAMGALIKTQFAAIDTTDKFAQRIGVATKELTKLQFAAELTGVESQQLNVGLQRMTRRVAEAAQGTGEAQNAIKELGLDAAALAAKTPDEMFRSIAEAMSQVPRQSDRVRLAFKLFDTEGVALINTLKLGRTELDAIGKDAERAGIAFDDAMAAKVAQANDAMTRAKAVFRGLATQIAVQLAPFVEAAANKFFDLATAGEGIGPKVQKAFAVAITWVDGAIDRLRIVGVWALKAQKHFAQMRSTWNAWTGDMDEAVDAANEIFRINGEIDRLERSIRQNPALNFFQSIADEANRAADAVAKTRSEERQLSNVAPTMAVDRVARRSGDRFRLAPGLTEGSRGALQAEFRNDAALRAIADEIKVARQQERHLAEIKEDMEELLDVNRRALADSRGGGALAPSLGIGP